MSPKLYIITQEIDFSRPTSGRAWHAKIEWEIDVREIEITTPRGMKREYDATIVCGATVEEFCLFDAQGNEFASNGPNCLPDYVPYIHQAILADIRGMPVDWEEKAVAEAVERYREDMEVAA